MEKLHQAQRTNSLDRTRIAGRESNTRNDEHVGRKTDVTHFHRVPPLFPSFSRPGPRIHAANHARPL